MFCSNWSIHKFVSCKFSDKGQNSNSEGSSIRWHTLAQCYVTFDVFFLQKNVKFCTTFAKTFQDYQTWCHCKMKAVTCTLHHVKTNFLKLLLCFCEICAKLQTVIAKTYQKSHNLVQGVKIIIRTLCSPSGRIKNHTIFVFFTWKLEAGTSVIADKM